MRMFKVAINTELLIALTVLAAVLCSRVDTKTEGKNVYNPVEEIAKTEAFTEQSDPDIQLYPVPLDAAYQRYVNALCARYDVDPALVYAIMQVESGYNPMMTGDGGESIGIMQIYEMFHRDRMERLGVTDLADPFQNAEVGIDILSELNNYGLGDKWVLMAYNGGLTYAYLMDCQGVTSEYAINVLNIADNIRDSGD